MKKIYLSILGTVFAGALFAQVPVNDGGFETWQSGEPTQWVGLGTSDTLLNQGFTASVAGNPVPGSVNQMTTGSPAGSSHLGLLTATFTDGTDTYLRAGLVSQLIYPNSTPADELTFQYRANLQNGDTAYVLVQGFNGSFQVVSQAYAEYVVGDNSGTFATETVSFSGSGAGLQGYYIEIASSGGTPIEGSAFEVDELSISEAVLAPNVQNVVASDISDNADGTDLQVEFEVPADETDVANYYAVTFESGEENLIGQLQDPLAFVQGNGVQITPNGSNQTVTFTAADEAYRLNGAGTALESDPITENQPYVVVIYVEATNGATTDVFEFSNEVTLTSGGTGSIADQWKDNFKVYPNPTTNNVTFDFAGTNEVEAVTIMNVNGAVVKNIAVNGQSQVNANISDLASGMYIYQVISNEGKAVITNKIMKK